MCELSVIESNELLDWRLARAADGCNRYSNEAAAMAASCSGGELVSAGAPPLLLRHNEPNPVSSTTGHRTDRTVCLYGFINEISRKLPLLPAPPPPHTFSELLHFY